MNSGVELDDLVQEGWVGLLTGIKRYDSNRNISLGAFVHKYIFGRIFRSLLGTKNLLHNKKIILLELSDNIIDKNNDFATAQIDFWDYVENSMDETSVQVIKMHYQNYKKSEILRLCKISNEQYISILNEFDTYFD